MRCSCGTIFKSSFGNIKHRKSFLCVSCAQKMRHKKDKINNQIIDKMNQKFLEKGLVILQEIENSRDKILQILNRNLNNEYEINKNGYLDIKKEDKENAKAIIIETSIDKSKIK